MGNGQPYDWFYFMKLSSDKERPRASNKMSFINLSSKFSVNDVLLRAEKIQKININNSRITSEITSKTLKLLSDLGCAVT